MFFLAAKVFCPQTITRIFSEIERVIDTDFEQNEIDNAEPEYLDGLIKWQTEGSQWSKQVSEQSLGQYIPLKNSDHMAVFQRPDEIVDAINFLTQ